ncbi:MAG: pyrroline-5-carboxylate reductase [Acutalibacteraceae bacterium]
MSEKRIGFVGAGNMATAIINGVLRNKAKAPEFLEIYDLDEEKCRIMYEKGVCCSHSIQELSENCDIIVLAVKPQNYDEVLAELKKSITEDKVVVSIAAGISIDYVRQGLGVNVPMVRVMPNTPLLLGKGATAMCRSENISDEDFEEVHALFALSGDVVLLTEDKMNAVIAVNGSSPAYVYLFAKAMRDYAVSVGIDEKVAMSLICKTLEGSAEMLRSSGDTPDVLIQKVSSKGGTTIEALKVMNDNNIPDIIQEAMAACTRRAEELGK